MKDLKSLELELANLKVVLHEAIAKDSPEMIKKLRSEIKNVEKLISAQKMSADGTH